MSQTTGPTSCGCCECCKQNQTCLPVENDIAPDAVKVVNAGDVCESECAGSPLPIEQCWAAIQVNPQIYRTSFCPGEALAKGTLFPELVCPYTPRGC